MSRARSATLAVGLSIGLAVAGASVGLASSDAQDGSLIVYSGAPTPGASAETRQLYTIRPDGTGRQRVTHVKGGANRPSPIPRTSRVVYQLGGYEGRGFFVIGLDGRGMSRLRTSCRGDCLEELSPAVSPDGRRLAFIAINGPVDAADHVDHVDVVVSNLDGSGRRVVYSASYGRDGREPSAPDWSSDGKSIAFTEDHRDGRSTLAVVGADGRGYRVLPGAAMGLKTVGGVSWSRRGLIAFAGCTTDDSCEIYSIRTDGSGRRRLTRGPLSLDPDWSPDGSRIVFVRWDPAWENLDVWVMNADGSGQQRVLRARTLESAPAWVR